MKNIHFRYCLFVAFKSWILLVLLSMLVLCVRVANASPSNDNFANAIDLGGALTLSSSANNIGATLETGEPNPLYYGNAVGGASVWWKWTAPVSGQFYFRASYNYDGSYMSPVVVVATGDSVSTLTQVGLAIYQTPVCFTAVAGTTYYIAVHGFYGAQGDFILSLGQPPANDAFANAVDLGNGLAASSVGNNVGASLETGETNPVDPTYNNAIGGASVWWKWTAPVSGRFYFKTSYPGYGNFETDTVVVVATGNSVSTLTQVGLGISQASATFTAVAGTTYYIAVHGHNGAQGDFMLSLGQPPANDDFAQAIDLGNGLAASSVGNNVGASLETGETNPVDPTYNNAIGGSSVWWKWTAPVSGRFYFKTAYPGYGNYESDTVVVVATGNSVSTLTQVSLGRTPGSATFTAVEGTTYYIAVHGHNGAQGDFMLSLGQPPANDDFANAIDLGNGAAVSGSGNNVGATLETGETNPVAPNSNAAIGGASVWWKWTAPVSGRFYFKTASVGYGNSTDTVVLVATGNSVSTLTQVGLGIEQGSAIFTAVAGTTYYIAVHGYYGSQGDFMLSLGQPPANDDFANAIDLGNGAEASGSGTNVGASLETGEVAPIDGSSSIWWKWTAPTTGKYSVNLVFSGTWTGSELYNVGWVISSGNTLATQTVVGSGTSSVAFSAKAGTTYYIALYGLYGTQGTVQFSLGVPPVNDNVADATVLSGGRVLTATANALHATSETNEIVNGSSVWWKWTAPKDTQVTVDTEGSLVDVSLAVEQASTDPVNAGSMTLIGIKSGHADPGNGSPARFSFSAKAGQVYYFCVIALIDGTVGEVHLRIATPPANDNQASATDLGSNGDQTVTGDNFGATSEASEPKGQNSIWWKYTEAIGGKVQSVDTLGSDFDTVLEVYTRSNDGTLSLLRHCDDAGDDGHSRVAFPVTSGSSYYIRVIGKNKAKGNVTLHLKSAAPATTAAGHILWARALLETLDGEGGIAAADAHLASALAADSTNGEANLLRAFTQLALVQQQSDAIQLLSTLGVSKTGPNGLRSQLTLPKDSSGVPITTAGSSTSLLVNYLKNNLSTLDLIDGYLNKISGNNFLTTLSDSESGRIYVKIDAGDVQIIRAVLRGIKAVSYFSQTYDLAGDLNTVIHQSRYKAFNPETLKNNSSYSNVLKFATGDRRNDFRDILKEANAHCQLGYGYAKAARSSTATHYLFPMGKDADNVRSNAADLSASLDGSVLWNGTQVDLSKFVSSGASLRDFLTNFHGRKVVANTAPDPFFGGVLPTSSQDSVNTYLQKRGLLYNLSSYANWAAELLPDAAPADQAADASPAHDGISNRTKYAFGLDPQRACTPSEYLVQDLVKDAGDNQKYLTVSFVRRIDDRTLSYVVAVSDDLKTWDRTQTQLEQVGSATANADGITETVVFRFKSAALAAKKFVRIEVRGPNL